MKIFRKDNYLQIVFSSGNVFISTACDDALWKKVTENQTSEETLKEMFIPTETIDSRIENSTVLIKRGMSVYMRDVSELSIPEDFVLKILKAEENNDWKEVNKYKNFWTLVSMNPDSRVRNNIFWFIRKWDMKITDLGFVVGYRNVDVMTNAVYSVEETKNIIMDYYKEKYVNHNDPKSVHNTKFNKSLEELYDDIVNKKQDSPVFTDCHTRSFRIKLGEPVRMDRELVDMNQEHSCSSGLHVGAKGWLKQSYYGHIGLQVLVNPAKICAVPTIDNYGKMRVCEYLPIAIIDYDDNNNVIEPEVELYKDVQYLKSFVYREDINNEDIDNYEIKTRLIDKEAMYKDILKRLEDAKNSECPA